MGLNIVINWVFWDGSWAQTRCLMKSEFAKRC